MARDADTYQAPLRLATALSPPPNTDAEKPCKRKAPKKGSAARGNGGAAAGAGVGAGAGEVTAERATLVVEMGGMVTPINEGLCREWSRSTRYRRKYGI